MPGTVCAQRRCRIPADSVRRRWQGQEDHSVEPRPPVHREGAGDREEALPAALPRGPGTLFSAVGRFQGIVMIIHNSGVYPLLCLSQGCSRYRKSVSAISTPIQYRGSSTHIKYLYYKQKVSLVQKIPKNWLFETDTESKICLDPGSTETVYRYFPALVSVIGFE